ncbi:MAG: YicC family protein [Sedimentisphaerales bacterium]|nr:YicC family protein [Sedimentisphaerales bacterium]
MIHSMTGFGDAQYEANGVSFLVEIRSLNNRFLKTTIKLPDPLVFIEPVVERLIRQELSRGSVTCTIHMRHVADEGPFEVNQAAVNNYLRSLQQLLTLQAAKGPYTIDLASLLELPGVTETRAYSQAEHERFQTILIDLVAGALTNLRRMRAEEGAGLAEDLRRQCLVIEENLSALAKLTDEVLKNYHQRLQQRANILLAEAKLKLDDDQLAREVALFAERCDINEEIHRLQSHLSQFRQAIDDEQQAGRRLDFITQEMLREANTIASKANDARISQHVVSIKVAIDRLKEQIQNAE